jgi:hypothetical protein
MKKNERLEAAIRFVYANLAISDIPVTVDDVRRAFHMRHTFPDALSNELVSRLVPGQHVVYFSEAPEAGLEGRRFGLELRDTFLVLSPGACRFAFLLRVPIEGTVTENVLKHGHGALNIEACKIPANPADPLGLARWPANLLFIHDPACQAECVSTCPVAMIDAQTGILKSGKVKHGGFRDYPLTGFGDEGPGSRFFSKFRDEAELKQWFLALVGSS